MMRTKTILAAGLTALACTWSARQAAADTWKQPQPRLFISTGGRRGLKVLPARDANARTVATAIQFRLEPDGSERELWKVPLVNQPVLAFVDEPLDEASAEAPQACAFATINEWGRAGYGHSLVVYSGSGQVLCDLTLEMLLTPREIAQHTTRSVSSRHWLEGAALGFHSRSFDIDLPWGKSISVDSQTGAIHKTTRTRSSPPQSASDLIARASRLASRTHHYPRASSPQEAIGLFIIYLCRDDRKGFKRYATDRFFHDATGGPHSDSRGRRHLPHIDLKKGGAVWARKRVRWESISTNSATAWIGSDSKENQIALKRFKTGWKITRLYPGF